jgi:hypothetical protein
VRGAGRYWPRSVAAVVVGDVGVVVVRTMMGCYGTWGEDEERRVQAMRIWCVAMG